MFKSPLFQRGKESQENSQSQETSSTPSIEFLIGVPEELSNVSLRTNKNTGVRGVSMSFNSLKAIEKLNSFTKSSSGTLRLIDSEGRIDVEISSLKMIFADDEGENLKRVDCRFEIHTDDHWERFMRFMHRYAEANDMEYGEK